MSWISDVRSQLGVLDTSPKSLRKFAHTVGIVFLLLGGYAWWKQPFSTLAVVLGSVGLVLNIAGLLYPAVLRPVYRLWMGAAFAMGWLVSHLILVVFYYGVITPVAIALRILGKQFLDIDFRRKQQSYWIRRDASKKVDYEKMY